jgi:hypothetical protein
MRGVMSSIMGDGKERLACKSKRFVLVCFVVRTNINVYDRKGAEKLLWILFFF